jgi:hypothetical protein
MYLHYNTYLYCNVNIYFILSRWKIISPDNVINTFDRNAQKMERFNFLNNLHVKLPRGKSRGILQS